MFESQYAVLSTLTLAVLFPLIKWGVKFVMSLLCASVPDDCAFLPAKLPHHDPEGETPPFTLPVAKASQSHVNDFLVSVGEDPSEHARVPGRVGAVAAAFKGSLFDRKVQDWQHRHFELREKGLKFPVAAPHWNGWAGWWAEIGPLRRDEFAGCVTFCAEHVLCGLLLPLHFIVGKQLGLPFGGELVVFQAAVYGDIGANVVDIVLTASGYISGVNRSLTGVQRAIWPLVILHHVGAIGMEIIGLSLGDEYSRELGCFLLISLLGTTGAMHLAMVPLGLTPVNDQVPLMFGLQSVTVASMVWFRAIYWWRLSYDMLSLAYAWGWGYFAFGFLALGMFTLFNYDFVVYHTKVLKALYRRMKRRGGGGGDGDMKKDE